MNRGQGPPPSPMHIQKILDENAGLIQTIQDFQNMGKAHECMSYHVALHRNLVYLANLADPQHNIQALLPVSVGRIVDFSKSSLSEFLVASSCASTR